MTQRITPPILVTSLCVLASVQVAVAAPEALGPQATAVLESHRAQDAFPGAVMAVHGPDGSSTVVTSGVQTVGGQIGVDANVPWLIGSVTKTFVTVVVLQLAQEGALDLDQSIGTWFPSLVSSAKITVRHLLQHTSGLGDYLEDERVLGDAKRAWSPQELIAVAASRPTLGEPGGKHHYSNTNFIVVGEIIGKVAGRPWYSEVRTRILEPLGLTHTGYPEGALNVTTGDGHIFQAGVFVEASDRRHMSLGGAAQERRRHQPGHPQ